MLKEGDKAPSFCLPSDSRKVCLSDFKGKKIVLYFYPKDDTAGCTIEGIDFTKLLNEFKKKNTVVLGVSKDSVDSHCSFKEKHSLSVELLSDDSSVCEKYDSFGNKGIFGLGVKRNTFLIDENGKIKKIWKNVIPIGHAHQVLESI
ncbi:peroxiredoxin [Candidatus Micrarchaeota archaeon]|nr:peroxiredoxin [Candidatus Micrarchaeota archaeon]